jgi:hypothetical protein
MSRCLCVNFGFENIVSVHRSTFLIPEALDKCGRFKVVRFRCSTQTEPFYAKGLLGLLDCERESTSEFETDHAVMAVRKMEQLVLRFCTPMGKRGQPLAPDHALFDHIVKHVYTVAADGAADERRALFLAAIRVFTSVVLVIRDPAHAIRIAVKHPLHSDAVFGDVWEELFDKRHALVPDIQNSEKWRNLFRVIQAEVLAMPGQSQPLACVLKHLSFAKQRFDSAASPEGKLALMLLPVATLLASMASDQRLKTDQRQRATDTLKKFTSKFCLALGLSADWGIVCEVYVGWHSGLLLVGWLSWGLTPWIGLL